VWLRVEASRAVTPRRNCRSRRAARNLRAAPTGKGVTDIVSCGCSFVRPRTHFEPARKRGSRNRLWEPIVWYSGPETAWPVTEAGIPAVRFGNREALAAAVETVLSDGMYRRSPAERSAAQKSYFSWLSIAERSAAELRLRNKTPVTSAAIDSGATVRI
jgi:hypothetical protein